MVDWDGLENRSRCKPTVGSNPTPSATETECQREPIVLRPKSPGGRKRAKPPDPTNSQDV